MKILVICQNYFPEQFRINDICEELVEKGEEVTVLTGLPNYPKGYIEKEYRFFKKRKETINGVNIRRCWEIGRRKGNFFRILNYFSYAFSASIKMLLTREKYDMIFVYQLSPVLMAIPGIVYKKKFKKKLILYCLDLWPESLNAGGISKSSIIYRLFNKISNWIYNYSDEILVTSKSFIRDFEKKCKHKIDIKYLPQYAEDKLHEKSKKQEDGFFNVFFAGNIGKAQSVDTIISAAKIIHIEEKKIKFHIVGDGSELENCRLKAQGLENIKFYGQISIEQMQDIYDKADAMLVTLDKNEFSSKTLPGKVQACMKTKNAIIAAANGETEIIINEAKCGYCVEAENDEKLAGAILKFYKLPLEEKQQMENNSIDYYNKNFKKEIFILNLLNILKERGKENV